MKEIKFRAWNRKRKKFIKNLIVRFFPDGNIEIKQYKSGNVITKFILMQFTGLKDKNGKEIYEGDFLLTTKGMKPFLVKDIRMDTLTIARMIKERQDKPNYFTPIEVIGNIYENPELLEEKK